MPLTRTRPGHIVSLLSTLRWESSADTLSLHCTLGKSGEKASQCCWNTSITVHVLWMCMTWISIELCVCLSHCGPVSLSHTVECDLRHFQTQSSGPCRVWEAEQNWGEFTYHFPHSIYAKKNIQLWVTCCSFLLVRGSGPERGFVHK